MFYNVYKHLSDEDFKGLEAKLKEVEPTLIAILEKEGFSETSKLDENDALILDFGTEHVNYYGSVGIKYNDLPDSGKFSAYVLKCYDSAEEKRRYYKKELIQTDLTIQDILKDIDNIASRIIQTYQSWQQKDLSEYVNIS